MQGCEVAALIKKCRSVSELLAIKNKFLASIDADTPYLPNLIILMFGRLGSIQDAIAVFDSTHNRNLFSWNILLQANAQTGHFSASQWIFSKMPSTDVVSSTALLMMLCQRHSIQEAKHLFATLPQRNIVCWNAMVSACAKASDSAALDLFNKMPSRSIESATAVIRFLFSSNDRDSHEQARLIFDRVPERDAMIWTAMVLGHSQSGNRARARSLFDRMPFHDVMVFSAILELCCALEETKSMFDAMPERNIVAWTYLLQAIAQEKPIREEILVFDLFPHHDVVSSTVLLESLIISGSIQEGRSIFESMPQRSSVCWNAILSGYVQSGSMAAAAEVLDLMPQSTSASFAAMVHGFGLAGRVAEAKSVFDRVPERNQAAWNALLQCCKNGAIDLVELVFERMPCRDLIAINILLLGYSQTGRIEAASSLFRSIPDKDIASWNSMLAAHALYGDLESVSSTFEALARPDRLSWNSMLAACARSGDALAAIDLFKRMILEGSTPDEISFLNVLSGLAYRGLVDEGLEQFRSMRSDFCLDPRVEHYTCVVNLLSRCVNRDDLESLIETIPSSSGGFSWTTFLSACVDGASLQTGSRTAATALEIDSTNAGTFVTVSNLLKLPA